MSLHTDEQFLAAAAAALGETIAFVRRRGFHLDRLSDDFEAQPSGPQARRDDHADDDALDLGAVGIDWDADDDSRPCRRPRRLSAIRSRRRAA